jgi:hypothetical protein
LRRDDATWVRGFGDGASEPHLRVKAFLTTSFPSRHSQRPSPLDTITQAPYTASNMENGNLSQGEGKDPSAFLSEIIGNSVTVKLNSGVVYKGMFDLFQADALTDAGVQENYSLLMDT